MAAVVAVSVLVAGATSAQVTERVSVATGGAQADNASDQPFPEAVVSADGRYVAFMSVATNLVPGDTNGAWAIFLPDRLSGRTEGGSVDSKGVQGNGFSGVYGFAMSPDGRYGAFESRASNLVPGDTNGASDIFLRDRVTGTTERVSASTGGAQGDADCLHPSISPDGRYVAFASN